MVLQEFRRTLSFSMGLFGGYTGGSVVHGILMWMLLPVILASATSVCFSEEPLELLNMPHAWADGPPKTILVPSDYATIQEGIAAALSGDTVLVSPGTFYENIDFLGKAIVVTSEHGPDSTTIDGNGLGSVVMAASGEPEGAEISGFTIKNGYKYSDYGGGIYCDNRCELMIRDNIIAYNHAQWGGGVSADKSNIIIEGNIISSNDVTRDGGGIYGIDCVLLIYGNIIKGSLDGGIYSRYSELEIEYNEISDNADYKGAGINALYCSTVRVCKNIIINNEARWAGGGGVYFSHSDSIFVYNNTIAFNIANEEGSNVLISGNGYIEFTNNIIAFGIGSGGIYNLGNENVYIIEYNDVYGNEGFDYFDVEPGTGNMSFDPLLDENYNLDWRSPCIDMGDPSMTPPAGGGERIDIGASEFPYLADPPVTIEELSIPDTVDTGSTAEWSLSLVNGTLQKRYVDCFVSFMKVDYHEPVHHSGLIIEPGEEKTIEGSFYFDEFFPAGDWEIMARTGRADSLLYTLEREAFYVFRAPRIINVPGDFGRIQPAIDAAVDGDTILVAAGVYEEALDFLGKGIIVASASGMDCTTILNNNEMYGIVCKWGEGGRGVLSGFTVGRNGSNLNTGLLVDDFDLSVLDCRFSDWEQAVICTGTADVRLVGCEITGNYTGIRIYETVNLDITDCDVCSNYESLGGFGGGIYCTNASTCLVVNTRLRNNSCTGVPPYFAGSGGALALDENSFCSIENSELISNSADWGGGIYISDYAVLEVENSIISGNGNKGVYASNNCTLDIKNSFINGNSGSNGGGGLSIDHNCVASIENTEICGNSVSPGYMSWYAVGAGVNVFSEGEARLVNCAIRDNTCHGGEDGVNPMGGGIYKVKTGYLLIEKSEITGNRLNGWDFCYPTGAGVYLEEPCDVKNTVILRNIAVGGLADGGGMTLLHSVNTLNSIIRDNSPDQIYAEGDPVFTYSNIEDGWPGEGNIDVDPLFVLPSYRHFSLSPGSPCIDTGDPVITDPDGTRSDMGAYGGPGAKPVNMTIPVENLSGSHGDTLEFEILLTNNTSFSLNVTIHSLLRNRDNLAKVRLLGNGGLVLEGNDSKLISVSGVISPILEPGGYYLHLYVVNDLRNDPPEFSNIELGIS